MLANLFPVYTLTPVQQAKLQLYELEAKVPHTIDKAALLDSIKAIVDEFGLKSVVYEYWKE